MEWWQDISYSLVQWYRSWPLDTKAFDGTRAWVVDRLPRLLMSGCDYNSVELWPHGGPGFAMLEWDVALDRRERAIFAEQALESPDEVLVGPYWKSYGGAMKLVHRKNFQGGPTTIGAPTTDLFGFGCIYMPYGPLFEFLATEPDVFSDTTFSIWYRKTYGKARLTWDVHPQHLHGD